MFKSNIRKIIGTMFLTCLISNNVLIVSANIPVKTINDYNIYKPIEEAIDVDLENDDFEPVNTDEPFEIKNYSIESLLKPLEFTLTNDLMINKNYSENHFVNEDGQIVLANGKIIEENFMNTNYTVGQTLEPKYIIIHDTGNRNEGADAMAHYKYWTSGNSQATSAHYVVDDENVMHLLELDKVAWHTGILYTNNPEVPNAINSNSIGIELCVNEDGDFIKTMQNGIELTKYLMEEYDIPKENVITHYQSTGKICPAMMIQDKPYLWDLFKSEISKTENTNENLLLKP